MSQKPRVGQNSSNALRTYNRVIGNVKTQCEKFKELGNVSGKPLRMAVVFTTRDGMIQCVGAKEWTNIIMDNCMDQLIQSLTNQEIPESPKNARVGLLRLPKPVSLLNSKTLQSIIPLAMKNLQGGGYIKWDQASAKPEWWPEDVVFANVKQRPAEQSGDIPWVQCLRKILSALFAHYGYDAETYVVEEEKDDGNISGSEAAQHPLPEERDTKEALVEVQSESAYDQELDDDDMMFKRLSSSPLSHSHAFAVTPRYSTPSSAHVPMEATSRTPLSTTHCLVLTEGTPKNNAPTPPSAPREDSKRRYQISTPTATPHLSEETFTIENTSSRISQQSVPRKVTPRLPDTPKLPRYITGKRNWVEKENDPAVQDFLGSFLNSPKRRRKIRPRQVLTPSAYD